MLETAADIERLQAQLDESVERAGPGLRKAFGLPDYSLTAGQLAERLQGSLMVAVASVTAIGEPRVSPTKALFVRGTFYVPTLASAARSGHLARRPAVSLTYFQGTHLAVIVHGQAKRLTAADPAFEQLDEVQVEAGNKSVAEWGEDGIFLRIDPSLIYNYAFEP